jgi:hypothetical protein
MSYFESRSGEMDCTPEEVFYFMTDMRNFKRFVPSGAVSNYKDDINSCSFSVPQAGQVNVRLDKTEKYDLISYRGDALKENDFELMLHISRKPDNFATVKVTLNADLNPMIKMFASKPIAQFLEMVIDRMERLNCREELTK